jgi:2-keto-4-pentenoate hydratase
VNPNSDVDAFSREILGIFRNHRLVRHTGSAITSLSLQEAYEVQDRCIADRVSKGESTAGWKIGCTSKAIQQQFGLTQPICGRILSPHVYDDGAAFSMAEFVNCAVEPEMVFHIGSDLSEDMRVEDLRARIAAVSAGVELHNYRFWYGKASSQELIASNGIHAALVVAKRRKLPPDTNLDLEEVQILVNGGVAAVGKGAEIMGGPLNSLCWLVRDLASRGLRVRAGDLVIPGSPVKLVSVAPGDEVEARFASLGNCIVRFHL